MQHFIKRTLLFGPIYFLLVNGAFSQSKGGRVLDGADTIYEQGVKLMRQGRYQEARALLEKTLQTDSSDPKIHELLGDAYEQLRDSYHAVEAYTESLKRDPLRFTPYDKRAHMYFVRKEWNHAIADYNKAIQMRPDILRNYSNRALAYRELGQFAKARADFENAYERGMVNPTAFYLAELLATCPESAIRDGQRAIEYAQEACKQRNFKDYQSLSILAAAYAEAGQWDEAMQRSKQAMEMAVGQDRTSERWSWESYQFHEPRRHFKLELVANKPPSTAGEAVAIAWVKYSSRDRIGAIADARKAIELNPRFSPAHSSLGVFIMTENLSEAINHFTNALKANHDSPDAFAWRGTAYLLLGKYREALKDSGAALGLDAKLPIARCVNLNALAGCGEVDRALAKLNTWSREGSNELIPNSVRGYCYLIQGKYNAAVAELTQAIQRGPSDIWSYSNRAVALTALGKPEEAMQDLEKCSQLAPCLRAPTEERMRATKQKQGEGSK